MNPVEVPEVIILYRYEILYFIIIFLFIITVIRLIVKLDNEVKKSIVNNSEKDNL